MKQDEHVSVDHPGSDLVHVRICSLQVTSGRDHALHGPHTKVIVVLVVGGERRWEREVLYQTVILES